MDNDKKLKKILIELLKKIQSFCDSETGELNYIKVKDSADKIDEKLISILVNNKDLKAKFFTKIKDIYVFNIQDFKFFLDESRVSNSYTKYTNRIGLADNNGLLENISDVVLDFPFKDCVLEGGQSTEEGTDTYFEHSDKTGRYEEKTAKRNEIFFNQILAHDEVDRLYDRKTFVNWKRFTKNSKKDGESVKEIKRDKTGLVQENLIIKGNNLLALHSLKSELVGKVKLIYADPPYNTGGSTDTFTYNNNFKHSTWLTFMKNRLDVAKELLKEDGFIAVTIDHEELFYLGALMDEVFNKENRVGIVTIYINPKGRQHEKFFSASTEYMLVYAKDVSVGHFRKVTLDEDKELSFDLEDKEGKYRLEKFIRARTGTLRKTKPNFWYPIYVSDDLETITHKKTKGYSEVLPIENGKEFTWKIKRDSFIEKNTNGFYVAAKENNEIKIYHKYREQQVIKNLWLDKKYFPEFQGTNLLKKILGENKFSYPKSLYAVMDTLKLITSENDIILDYHAGSGTTGHATLELNKEDGGNRKFILIEQLDEHINICNERNQKVLAHNNIDDSFIYLELAKWNEKAKEEIQNAKDLNTLVKLFDALYEKYFLNYNVNIKDFKEKIIKEEEFKKLSLVNQKKMFLTMLDLNQMYVNESEMADKKYGISSQDQKLTKIFYSKK
tara:strand:- start:822 stop:2828 length:2007 start_codon:yes stop_codon:yes gene_type:complete